MQDRYEVAVIGGGLAGFGCALGAAQSGKSVLLVERRPALGWESTWAGQLDWHGSGSPLARRILDEMGRVGGLCESIVDGPILEMLLDRLAQEAGVSVLLYSYPIRLVYEGDLAIGVVLGSRSGEQVVQAGVIVDATEEAILWSQTGIEALAAGPVPARHSFFMNHVEGSLEFPLDLGGGVVLWPSVWDAEVRIEYDVGEADPLAARRELPQVIARIRQLPQCADAFVTHVANEPFPLAAALRLGQHGTTHPALRNLFGAGIWAENVENGPAGRLSLGERVGAAVAACEAAPALPERLAAGSVFDRAQIAGDVLVVGGGTAGTIAAIAAAREGAKTALLENTLALGGIGTTGAIHYYYHGLSGGIQDEVDARLAELTPAFNGKWGVHGFHPEAKKQVLQEMAEEAGVEIHLDTVVTGVLLKGGEVHTAAPPGVALAVPGREERNELLGVVAASLAGISVYEARVFIDSTGDGDVAAMAGVPFMLGREKDNICHTYSQPAGQLDAVSGAMRGLNFDAGYVDPTDVEDVTRARRYGIQLYWQQWFSDETRLLYIAPLIGVRQGRQIVGEYQLTLADEVAGRRFDDAVSFMQAHYDNHSFDYENESDQAALWVWALGNWRKPFGCEIPYRCLLPLNVDGLLVASRALSITYDAHQAFRMQKDLQRIGEVAGLAAAQAVRKGVPPRQVDVGELQAILRASGVLDERHRPKPAIPERRALELPDPVSLDAGQARDLVWLAVRGGTAGVPALREALRSADPDVRFKASVALASRGVEEGMSLLRQYVEGRNEYTPEGVRTVPVWQAAIPFLGVAGDQEALPALIGVLRDAQAPLDALIAAVRSLGRIGDARAVCALRELLGREALPLQRTFRTISGVRPAVEDARWQLNLATAEALAALGAPAEEVRAVVQPYLDDGRAYVRRYAGKVLREAGIAARGAEISRSPGP